MRFCAGVIILSFIICAVVGFSCSAPCLAQAAASVEADVLLVIPVKAPRSSAAMPISDHDRKAREDQHIAEVYRTITQAGCIVERTISFGDRAVLRLRTKPGELSTATRLLQQSLYFEYIQHNYFVYLCAVEPVTPNDPLFPSQSALTDINVLPAWLHSKGNMTVGIIDSGVVNSLTDLQNKVTFSPADTSPGVDQIGHGTAIASVIAATTYNSKDMAAVAPDARIYSYKATSSKSPTFTVENVIAGLTDCMNRQIKIVNIGGNVRHPYTLSSAGVHPVLHAVFNHFYSVHGGLIFLPAGNTGIVESGTTVTPPHPIVVDAVGVTSQRPSWATAGANAWFPAPGENVTAMDSKTGKSIYVTGSSYSSAIGAAVAALVWSSRPQLTNAQVAQILRTSVAHTTNNRRCLSASLAMEQAIAVAPAATTSSTAKSSKTTKVAAKKK